MELQGEAKLLRMFIGESDRLGHTPLHEAIVKAARADGLAGATVWRGLLGYGPTSKIRTAKVLDLSTDLPVVIEIVDDEKKIEAFLPKLHDIFEQAKSGGLVTVEKVHIIKYVHGANT
jgi:PII-like signaling protein